jgi:beta-glucosidase/6-phospho-beta-glucosidase/beta-galactosidase
VPCSNRLLAVLLVAGCGTGEHSPQRSDSGAPAADAGTGIHFPGLGPLAAPSGRGSFRFGAASAATQIEDQNTSTDWFLFTEPAALGGLGKGAAFVGDASKGFTKAIDDIALLQAMHLDSYRFSMEWARIEPERDVIDEAALAHYSDVLDALVAAHIKPNVTIHHFSNPVWIDDPRDTACKNGPTDANLCGLGHPAGGPLVIEEMRQHARLLAERFGDRVDDWATLNEPVNYLLASYGIGTFPPGKVELLPDPVKNFVPVMRDYIAAHAAMYAAIKEADTVDADGDGVAANVGMTISVAKWEAARDNQPSTDAEDTSARDRLVYVFHHLLPDSVTAGTFDANLDGTPDEVHGDWANTLDWLGLQYYMRSGVTGKNPIIPVVALTPCFSGVDGGACLPPTDPTFCVPAMQYETYPPGFYDVIMDFSARYPKLPLLASEAGLATEVGERRAENVVRILQQLDRARKAGADLRGYYHWSLYDNFEWTSGFVPRFGLYRVDYAGSYDRTATAGADVLGAIAKVRTLTPEQVTKYGGDGPMVAEGKPSDKGLCSGATP